MTRRGMLAAALIAAAVCVGDASAVGAQGRPLALPEPAAMPADARDRPMLGLMSRAFQEIAFSAEFSGAVQRGRIVKWVQPVRAMIISGNPPPSTVAFLRQHLLLLRRVTGLPITLVDDLAQGEPNLIIRFRPLVEIRETLDQRFGAAGGVCFVQVSTDSLSRIIHAEASIIDDDDHYRRHCIVEELTQALGLLNDSDILPGSIFSDKATGVRLESVDVRLLRTLYDPRIAPGMTEAEAMPLAQDILRDLLSK